MPAGPAVAGPAATGVLVGEPRADLSGEPEREEHDRRYAGLIDRGGEGGGVRAGQRGRLLQQQVLARPGGPGRDGRLNVRWHGEGDGVDAVEEGVDGARAGKWRGPVFGRQVGGSLRIPAPDRA